MSNKPLTPRTPTGRSGKLVVLAMLTGGVILALIALRYRQMEPLQAPAAEPTTRPASTTSS
jgi:hypothetical protein